MTEAAFGIGIVGCGAIGFRRAAVAAAHPGSRVVAVADPQTERAQQTAESTGAVAVSTWQAVVDHPGVDVVVVATTHDWLAPISVRALEAGKHVLCEKPMSVNSQHARRIVAAAKASGRHVKVGYNHRYHPAIREAYERARTGVIGDLLFIRCRYGHGGRPGYDKEWRMNVERSGGGELLDQGIHAIDLFRWFLGPLHDVLAVTSTWVWSAPVEDNAFAIFRTLTGQVASLHASWTQWKNLFSFEVWGTDGGLVVEGLGKSYGTERLYIYKRRPSAEPDEERLDFPGPDRSWEFEWTEFLAGLRDERQSPVTADEGLEALQAVEAAYKSARSGAAVKISSV